MGTAGREDRLRRELVILRQLAAQRDDARARQALLQELLAAGEWLPQITALARRWRCRGVSEGEFIGAGTMGLLEAAARYDGREKGWPTYAMRWIRRCIQDLARLQGGPIALETRHEQRKARRTGAPRRTAFYAHIDGGDWELERCHPRQAITRNLIRVLTERADIEQDQAAHQEQIDRLGRAVAALPPEDRAAMEDERSLRRAEVLRKLRAELEG